MMPVKVLLLKALMPQIKPVWLQSLEKGSGGEMADHTQKIMCTQKNRKKMAYVNALSLIVALYTRMYLRAPAAFSKPLILSKAPSAAGRLAHPCVRGKPLEGPTSART